MGLFIRQLNDISKDDVQQVGGKGANLGQLIINGFNVPSGFCVTSDAYRLQMEKSGLIDFADKKLQGIRQGSLSIQQAAEEINKKFNSIELLAEIEKEISSEYLRLCSQNSVEAQVAVRSSATAEDLEDASFAGQQETYLNVVGIKNVLKCVKDCWASLWSHRSIHYREQKSFDHLTVQIAVVVQIMVPAEYAGVMFTVNPVTGNRDEMLIEAALGLGESIVSGEVTGDQYIVSKNDLKLKTVSINNAGKKAVTLDETVAQLARLGKQIEKAFDCPQDVEWAYFNKQIFILQSRPITTLTDQPSLYKDPDMYRKKVQREWAMAMAERYPNPIYPIDLKLVKILLSSQKEATASLGFKVIAEDLSLINRVDFPYEYPPFDVKPTPKLFGLITNLPEILRTNPNALWVRKNQPALLKLTDVMEQRNWQNVQDEKILKEMERIFEILPEVLLGRFQIYFKYSLITALFQLMTKVIYGKEAAEKSAMLLSGVASGTMQCNREMEHLAAKVDRNASVKNIFMTSEVTNLIDLINKTDEGKGFLDDFTIFMEKYGHREISMPLIGEPCWHDDPGAVLGMIKGMLGSSPATAYIKKSDKVKNKGHLLEDHLSKGIWHVVRIKSLAVKVTERAREFVEFRENSHLDFSRALYQVKRIFLELGNRLVERGLIECQQDLKFLTVDEIEEIIKQNNINDQHSLTLTIEKRKKLHKQRAANREFMLLSKLKVDDADLLGVPASAGIYSGPVRLIRNTREFDKLRPGDIMVCPFTNPTWTPLFTVAGAVVVETGGAASHAAIVAREYKIPAVMGVHGATRLFHDGQFISVDGYRGTIKQLKNTGKDNEN